MLKVWGRKTSSNVQAVMWCIGELGLEYQRIDAGHRFGVVDTDEYAILNPNRTVPTLEDGDHPPLWESGAILRYLANTRAEGAFWPADPWQRADVDRWAEWSKINFAMRFSVPVFWAVVRTAPAKRDLHAVAGAMAELARYTTIAENRLRDHDFLAGNDFTLADIQFGHLLYRYFDIEIERPDLPALAAYYQRLTERETYQEHVMVSYEDLRVLDPA
ncbi:MAG: glutathione S-transferase N-terminal domain-containing protein [Gammaproteobacteria bacterium]|nr:glutathione S-transferase N-terminal domain-containing protein [Gammaproteobacteria bacterium]